MAAWAGRLGTGGVSMIAASSASVAGGSWAKTGRVLKSSAIAKRVVIKRDIDINVRDKCNLGLLYDFLNFIFWFIHDNQNSRSSGEF